MTQQEKVIIEIEKIKEWFIRNSKHDCNNNAVLMDYTIPSVISLLEKQIEELKMAKIEEPQAKRWKPEYDETYWFLNGDVYCEKWTDCVWDNFQYTIGNCFKTEEEAKEYEKKIEYTALYKNYIEEHSKPLDWNNAEQKKWYAEFDTEDGNIEISCVYGYKGQGVIHASSEQIIWDAINEIGEDNFKKYVLGVK